VERLARARARASAPPLPEPLVLQQRRGNRLEVAACSAAAEALGIRPGEPLAAVCARVAGLAVAAADPRADAQALARLARWLQARISPLVALDPPDGLWIEAEGASHLFGGEARMLARLTTRLAASGLTARAGLADTAGAAHALARFAAESPAIAPPHAAAEAIAPLSVAALRIPPETAQELARLGIATIADLAAIPRAALGRRFGLALLGRLDQALGETGEPLDHLPHAAPLAATVALAEPVATAEALHALIDRLAPALAHRLADLDQGARALDLLFHRVDGTVAAVRAGIAAPTRAPAHIARLLHLLVEGVDPGFGIEKAVLACPRAAPLAPAQLGTDPDPAGLAATADRLAARLGPDALFRVAPRAGAFPEHSVARAPLLHPASAGWPRHLPRPTRLLDPPEPVEVIAMLPDRPPALLRWRGRRLRVRAADGPERMHAAWWEAGANRHAIRDYFTVELEDGTRLWLFRSGDGENPETGDFGWRVHGLFG
jgi:protein ImuB